MFVRLLDIFRVSCPGVASFCPHFAHMFHIYNSIFASLGLAGWARMKRMINAGDFLTNHFTILEPHNSKIENLNVLPKPPSDGMLGLKIAKRSVGLSQQRQQKKEICSTVDLWK